MEQDVRIIIASINSISDKLDIILPLIAPCYRIKSLKMKHKTGQVQEALTGLLLRTYLNVKNDEDISFSKLGKPELTNSNYHFSVSHSEECVVLAICQKPIGVDIEKPRKFNSNIANRLFTPSQIDSLNDPTINDEKRNYLFCKYWTKYEAIVKNLGGGLSEKISHKDYEEYISKVNTFDFDKYIISFFIK